MNEHSRKIRAIFIGVSLIASQAMFISFAHAATYLTLNSFSGTPGTVLTVSGGGLTPEDAVDIYLGSVSGTPQATTTVGNGTNFSANVTIPDNEPQGPLPVIGVDTSNHAQISNSFYVTPLSPSISVTAPLLTPFSVVSVTGQGYAPNEGVVITLGTASSTVTAGSNGSFTGSIIIPSVSSGLYILKAAGKASGVAAINYFWIDQFYPSAYPSTWYILPGHTLTFSGSGFAENETVNVYQGNGSSSLASFAANAQGGFTDAGGVTIPSSAAGGTITYDLVGAESGVHVLVTTAVGNYYPSLQPSTYYAVPNSSITVTGTGFAPEDDANIQANGSTSTKAAADANGTFIAPVTVPFSKTSTATIVAHGSLSNATTSVTITLASFYPSITPGSWYAYPGQSVAFKGIGFAPGETVTAVGGSSTVTLTADASGGFTTPGIMVPYSAKNIFAATFTGSLSGAVAQSAIAVGSLAPYLTASQYSVAQGQNVNVQGFGFGADETVHVTAGSFATDTIANAAGATPAVSIPTPFGSSTLKVIFTGDETFASSSLMISLTGFSATLSANDYYVLPGSTIQVNGSGFAPNETIGLYSGTATTTLSANASGAFTAPLTLPFLTGAAGVTISATGRESGAHATAAIAFGQFNPQVSPSTWFTAPGTNVQFTGVGFAPNEPVAATFNGAGLSPIAASASGTFNFGYTIPYGSATANFSFEGSKTGVKIPITVTLSQYQAYLQLSTYYAQGGTPLTITGGGFAPNEPVNLYFNGAGLASTTSNSSGTITWSGAVPFSPAGSGKAFNAVGTLSRAAAAAEITIAPVYVNLQLGSYAGAPGSPIDFIGSGYLPNEPVTVMTDRTGTSTVYTFNANGGGSFNNSGYSIPPTFTGGPLVITVVGQHSFDPQSINYYVTGP